MYSFLKLADVHLIPQRKGVEDLVLPSKLLGIMASGKPVVASSPCDSELGLLVDKIGIRVDPGNVIQFADAIRILLNDKKLNKSKGLVGFEYLKKDLDKKHVLKRIENEIKSLVKDN